MARLGHRQPNTVSLVRHPIVVGPIKILPPIKSTLAVERTRRELQPQVTTRSFFVRPVVVGPIAILPPIKTRLAAELSRREFPDQVRVKSVLRKPTVVQAQISPATGLTASSDVNATVAPLRGVAPAAINATSALTGSPARTGAPTPLQAQILTTLAARRHAAHSKLLPPNAINPAVAPTPPVAANIKPALVSIGTRQDYGRRKVQWKLSPPAVLLVPSTTIPVGQTSIKVKIAPQPRRLPATFTPIIPAVIDPIVLTRDQLTINTTLQATQTRQRLTRQTPKSNLVNHGLGSVIPAQLNSTSTVTASIGVLHQIVPTTTLTATSNITAGIIQLLLLGPSSINSTSTITANVSGGTPTPNTNWSAVPWAAVHTH